MNKESSDDGPSILEWERRVCVKPQTFVKRALLTLIKVPSQWVSHKYTSNRITQAMAISYFIDGKEGQGEDYAGAVDALPTDDLGYVRIKIPEKGALMISTFPGGFVVTDERLDGSSWTSPVMARDQVKNLIGEFLKGGNGWRKGLKWELTTLTTGDAWWRSLRLVLIGAVVLALACWLIKLFTK